MCGGGAFQEMGGYQQTCIAWERNAQGSKVLSLKGNWKGVFKIKILKGD